MNMALPFAQWLPASEVVTLPCQTHEGAVSARDLFICENAGQNRWIAGQMRHCWHWINWPILIPKLWQANSGETA